MSGPRAGLAEGVIRCTPVDLLALAADGFDLLAAEGEVATAAVIVDLDEADWNSALVEALVAALAGPGPVLIGFAREQVPEAARSVLECFTVTLAPSGPGCTWVPGDETDLAALCANVAAAPGAAIALHGLLRATSQLPVPEAVVTEASTYSMLLAGPEFQRWRESNPKRPLPPVVDPVQMARDSDTLHITLDNPKRRNAFNAPTRDALVEALRLPAVDPSITKVVVRGNGPIFCSGGDLDEFGTAAHPLAAYSARLSRNPGLLIHELRDRVQVHLHGAAVGAGIEMAAFAGSVTATGDAWLQLPELSLGLVPGAGGTVSIPRRIGRWRTAWMVLTAARVDAPTAAAWGLVDDLL